MAKDSYKGKNVIWESKTKQIIVILLCSFFTISGLWTSNDEKIEFWLAILLFGIDGMFMLIRFLNPKNIFVTHKSKIAKEILSQREDFFLYELGIFNYNKTGFNMTFEQTYNEYNWDDIKTIYGYKVNLAAYDEICLDFFTNDNEKFTITRSTPGWFQFVNRLDDNISSIKPDWYREIANSFEINITLIYDKQNNPGEEIRKTTQLKKD